MTQLIVKWRASGTLRASETVATGETGPEARETVFEMTDLTPDERALIVAQLGGITDRAWRADITDGFRQIENPNDWNQENAETWIAREPVFLDQVPTTAVIAGILYVNKSLRAYATTKTTAARAAREAQEKAKKAADAAYAAAKQTQQEALYQGFLPTAQAALASKDLATLDAALRAWPVGLDFKWRLPSESVYLRDRLVSERDYLRDLAREAAKETWITCYGSLHLRRAYAAGYDCGRAYWRERAAMEWAGYAHDFDDFATWSDRSMPSVKALDELDRVKAARPDVTVKVVWLTHPVERATELDFESCEAVTVRDDVYPRWLVKTI